MNESLEVCVKYWMCGTDTARKVNPEQLTRDGLQEAIDQLRHEISILELLIPSSGK